MSMPENMGEARSLPLEAYARMTNAELKVIGAVRGDKQGGTCCAARGVTRSAAIRRSKRVPR